MYKKLILLFALSLILVNCEIGPRKAIAQHDYPLLETEQTIDNMRYHIWYLPSNTSQTGYTVAVTNLTKDSLECAVYRKQLDKK